MKHIMWVLLLALLFVPVFAKDAGPGPAFNPATMVNATFTVAAVRIVPAGNPMAGVHLTVKSVTDTLDAYIAPAEFLKLLRSSYASGDKVHLIGSKVKFGDGEVLLTSEITKKDETITLREDDGAPVWENWGRPID